MRQSSSLEKIAAFATAVFTAGSACEEGEEKAAETQDAGPQAPSASQAQERVLTQSDLYRQELKERCLGVINGGDRLATWDDTWGEMDLQTAKTFPNGVTEFCDCDRGVQNVSNDSPPRPDSGVCEFFLKQNGEWLLQMNIGVNAHSTNLPPELGATACVSYMIPGPLPEWACPTDDPCPMTRTVTPEEMERMQQGERMSDTGDSLSYRTDEDTGRCGVVRDMGYCMIFPPDSPAAVQTDIASCRADFTAILGDIDEIIAAGQRLPITVCGRRFEDQCLH